jgi:hypothetical protein
MTDYIISEKGEEVISERHQKDFKKEENHETNNDDDNEDSKDDSSNEFTDVSFDDI